MVTLSADLQQSRRAFDHRVLMSMQCERLTVRAYPNVRELTIGARPLDTAGAGEHARAYRVEIQQPTLVGPDEWSTTTVIGINTEVPNYPMDEPVVWSIDKPHPWSPHWHPDSGRFCIGPFWKDHEGKALLGNLVTHVCRLLNWDEQLHKGYTGWNAAAVAKYWARGSRPLRDDMIAQYPVVPPSVLGLTKPTFGFAIRSKTPEFVIGRR